MYEDRLLPVQEWWLSDRLYILKDKPTVFGNPDYQLELPDKRTDQQRCVKLESADRVFQGLEHYHDFRSFG